MSSECYDGPWNKSELEYMQRVLDKLDWEGKEYYYNHYEPDIPMCYECFEKVIEKMEDLIQEWNISHRQDIISGENKFPNSEWITHVRNFYSNEISVCDYCEHQNTDDCDEDSETGPEDDEDEKQSEESLD